MPVRQSGRHALLAAPAGHAQEVQQVAPTLASSQVGSLPLLYDPVPTAPQVSSVEMGHSSSLSAIVVGNRVRIASGTHAGAVGTAKVCSSSFMAVQLDKGPFIPSASPSAVVRLVSIGDRVRIRSGPLVGKTGVVMVSSAGGVAATLDGGEFVPRVALSKVELSEGH